MKDFVHKQMVNIIGTNVHVGDLDTYCNTIINWAKCKKSKYICNANTHMLVYRKLNYKFGEVLDSASLITPDGGPLVRFIKKEGHKKQTRAAGYDLTLKLIELCEKNELSVGFFGSSNANLEIAKKNILLDYPNLKINILLSPPIFTDPKDVKNLIEPIQESECNILFVFLGCPKQENWMMEYTKLLDMPLVGVGGVIDLIIGKFDRAPKFMRENSLEWIYRLYKEPKRLYKRYLLYNSLYLYFLLQFYLKRFFLKYLLRSKT